MAIKENLEQDKGRSTVMKNIQQTAALIELNVCVWHLRMTSAGNTGTGYLSKPRCFIQKPQVRCFMSGSWLYSLTPLPGLHGFLFSRRGGTDAGSAESSSQGLLDLVCVSEFSSVRTGSAV